MKYTTLCYIEKDGCYLMLYRNKKQNDVNKGKWIGVGGHLEADETKEECLLREVFEETGLTLLNYELRGKIVFHIDDLIETSYLYTANSFVGTLKECDEGELKWVLKEDILKLDLWEADPLFLRKLLNNEKYFEMTLIYVDNKLVSYHVCGGIV